MSRLGVSLAYLSEGSFLQAADDFLSLQPEFALDACEVHQEGIQFRAGFCRPGPAEIAALALIRSRVAVLGFHLPYLDLNPVSADPDIADFAMAHLRQAIARAAEAGADYVVFHARGRCSPDSPRSADRLGWSAVVAQLSEFAASRKLIFCLENADDLRSIDEIAVLAAISPEMRVCLDMGHLFERLELPSTSQRVAARLWDRFLPWAAIAGKGMPFFAAGGLSGCLDLLGDRLYCLHVHNHNGRLAHQPLTAGKIELGRELGRALPAGIPVILEADYRRCDPAAVRSDLQLLRRWLS